MCWLHPVWCLLCVHAFILGIASDSVCYHVHFVVFSLALLCLLAYDAKFCSAWHCTIVTRKFPLRDQYISILSDLTQLTQIHIKWQVDGSTAQHSTAACIASRNDGRNTLVQTFWSVFLNCWSRFQTSKHAWVIKKSETYTSFSLSPISGNNVLFWMFDAFNSLEERSFIHTLILLIHTLWMQFDCAVSSGPALLSSFLSFISFFCFALLQMDVQQISSIHGCWLFLSAYCS